MGSDWELKDADVETETGDDDDDLEIIDKLMKPAPAKDSRSRNFSSRMYMPKLIIFFRSLY